MSRLALPFACASYDRIEPLRDGSVQPDNIDLKVVTLDNPREIFDRTAAGEFDLSEMSSADYITMVAQGASPFVALPVFTSRVFRHSFICSHRAAGIKTPKDLEGRRIGVPLYRMSAAIWTRGMLRDEYDVDLRNVIWVEGSIERPGSHGVPHERKLHRDATIETNQSPYSLSELLARREIDATLGALMPTGFGVDPNIVRMFPDFRNVERDYYQRTGLHPIMHLIVLRKSLLAQHPWIIQPLMVAFAKAKSRALARMYYTGAPKTMLPFQHAEVEETRALFGDDPWPDGIEANRKTLGKALDYMIADGLIASAPPLGTLFVTG